MRAAYKWLPVINDYCHGCGLCVEACEHDCLGMVWDFAKLEVPADCGSEGICMEVCPQGAIRMEWVDATGDQTIGKWCDEPPPLAPSSKSFWSFLGEAVRNCVLPPAR
jgi:Pyruvate/2-oxoacid:ferredoxin oxidoreductase delta subunit